MSKRTIANISSFVIPVAFAAALLLSCGHARSSEQEKPDFDRAHSPYIEPQITGRIKSKDIVESSGLAASKCQAGIFWTHNDSGDAAFIYAIDAAGDDLGTWKVTGADNRDWEDIAAYKDSAGQCYVYIGEIGNNEGKRDRTMVYRIKEPASAGGESSRKNLLQTEAAESMTINFPGARPNAETLLVHPVTGDIYIVTKRFDGPAAVFKVAARFGGEQPAVAQKLADITVPALLVGFLTGGDISPDGRRVVLCDYVAGYEYTLPNDAAEFDEIWHQTPVKFDIGDRKNGEAIAYGTDGNAVFTTSEGKNQPIYEMRRK